MTAGTPPGRLVDDRGTSTTLDVTLCLLLVSAAVGVLAAADPPRANHDPGAVRDAVGRLESTTVTVDYALPGTETDAITGDREVPARERRRTVHGTPAALLARAAVADLAVGSGDDGAADRGPFERAVADRAGHVLADLDATANATATYEPMPDTGVQGRTTVGPRPPDDVDLSVVRVTVPVGTGGSSTAVVRAAERDGFPGVARALADATLSVLLPPSLTRWGLRDVTTASAITERYRRLDAALGVDVRAALAGGRVERANDRLASALADRFEPVLRLRYGTPRDAAEATASAPRTVTIIVRTWSA